MSPAYDTPGGQLLVQCIQNGSLLDVPDLVKPGKSPEGPMGRALYQASEQGIPATEVHAAARALFAEVITALDRLNRAAEQLQAPGLHLPWFTMESAMMLDGPAPGPNDDKGTWLLVDDGRLKVHASDDAMYRTWYGSANLSHNLHFWTQDSCHRSGCDFPPLVREWRYVDPPFNPRAQPVTVQDFIRRLDWLEDQRMEFIGARGAAAIQAGELAKQIDTLARGLARLRGKREPKKGQLVGWALAHKPGRTTTVVPVGPL